MKGVGMGRGREAHWIGRNHEENWMLEKLGVGMRDGGRTGCWQGGGVGMRDGEMGRWR